MVPAPVVNLFIAYFLLFIHFVFGVDEVATSNPIRLTITPHFGDIMNDIELECRVLSNVGLTENLYIRCLTDQVRPSGILLKYESDNNKCTLPHKFWNNSHLSVCNKTLIRMKINFTTTDPSILYVTYECRIGNDYYDKQTYRLITSDNSRLYEPSQKSLFSSSHLLLLSNYKLLFISYVILSFSLNNLV
ncbi:unnamed protein product [Didymodactylos carnosus]|uniref:Uncharacterized protein n=1 Tax=Didymodactylos carnosus TaxID=1234261 RepID=A0A813Q864_9BILA|nr:unnamed protein product [Didymodactylos carnosus]CAF1247018.1 unnamed protein product [Didymodactylos carnosus]CAF3544621.1 unnamed protein product [Didymodactylos carnosus]CAF4054622.1 unnamed protein product [Didymodactylos carnosus]